jgi:hypothetical protein
MKKITEIILPKTIDNSIQGTKVPFFVFAMYAILSTVRSCIHIFTADSGAGSIAGMDLTVSGANGIIFAFGLWGSSQLLFAIIQLIVVFRYRALIPLMYLMLVLEILLRQLVGIMKPVTFSHTPPGAIGNQLVLPLAIIMLVLTIWSTFKQTDKSIASKP